MTDILFEEPGVARCLVAPDGTVLRANAEWLRWTGFALDELLGASVLDLFPDARDLALAMHARARAGHRVEVPRHAQRIRGRERWWEGSIAPVPMEGGTGLLITARDVGASAWPADAAAPLSEGERRLRALTDTDMIGVLVADFSGTIVDANDYVLRLVGRDRADLAAGRIRWSDITPPEWDEADRRAVAQLRDRGLVEPTEKEYVRSDGQRVPVLVAGARIGDSDQAICCVLDLTARRRADAALRESEARLRRLYESGMFGVLHFDLDGAITDANDRFLSMVGYDREDLRAGRVAWDRMTPPEHRAADERGIAELKARGVDTPYEKEFVRKDGSRVPVIIGAATYDEARHRGVAFVLDITDRKRAEERSAFLARFPEENPEPVLRLDGALRVLYANEAARTKLRPLGLEVGHAAPAAMAEIARRAFAERRHVRAELPCGTSVLSINVAPVGSEVNVYGQDITERKRAETALRESEQRYRTMGETLPYGVWLCNAEGGAEYVSQSFLDLLEMTQEEQRQFGWTRRLPPEEVRPMLEKWLHCVRTGTPWDSEHRVLGPDGAYHHVLTRGLPVRDESGRITCWVGINLDIDERKRMEQELREADRRKDEFLGMLSHELRNPLAPIRSSAYVLRHADPGGEQARRAQEVIERQTEHLTRLVDDLLDVTRIARGKIELRRARVDLREIVSRAAEDFRLTMRDRAVALEVALPDAKVWADADPTRVAQVVGNLLHNASKFTRAGDAVTLSLAAEDGTAEVRVRDTGAGIDPALLPNVFDPFVQGERTLARAQGGLGLGLALVKGITELHGGTVRAESAGIGRGSEFVVRLPAACTPAGGARRLDTAPRSPAGRRVLVVDDNADAAESLADLLRILGHEVEVAYDGPSAVAKARASPPDVVLCDLGLPGMSGYEVAQALRAGLSSAVRLVAVSGYAQPDDVKRAVDAGFDGHVAKPADPAELEKLVGKNV